MFGLIIDICMKVFSDKKNPLNNLNSKIIGRHLSWNQDHLHITSDESIRIFWRNIVLRAKNFITYHWQPLAGYYLVYKKYGPLKCFLRCYPKVILSNQNITHALEIQRYQFQSNFVMYYTTIWLLSLDHSDVLMPKLNYCW